MKKILSFILCLLATIPFFTLVSAASSTYENEYPYDTYTVDYEGFLTYTQTAYIPIGVLNRNDALTNPEDLYVKDGVVYVADTGASRVVTFDYAGNLTGVIGSDLLNAPTGVFVSAEDYLYVADQGNKLVYKFDLDGNLIRTYDRPTEPLFGTNSPYTPTKVVVGAGENIYVIGDGSTSGVIQLNYDGSFMGYFGVNLSNKSLIQKIAEWFVNPGEYALTTPPSPTNIAINEKSLVYTSTPNAVEALKKLDVNGNNILSTINYNVEQSVVDLSVSAEGYLYAIYDDGLIVEYDPNGNLLFAFDVVSSTSNILGLIQNPSSIQIDEEKNIFVLDMGRSEIMTYRPSSFTNLVHEAIDMYNQGSYALSTQLFEEILTQNDNFALAHSALGKAYYQDGRYQDALEEYRKASDLAGYSETYWKIRDIWLKDNLSAIFTAIAIVYVFVFALKIVDKRSKAFASIHGKVEQIRRHPNVQKVTLLNYMMKHPIDASYQIKREHRSNWIWASGILLVLFLEYLALLRFEGFVFQGAYSGIRIGLEMAKFFGVVFLFVFSNYLISTLYDGEGWLKDVYVGVVYALAPLVVFLPVHIVLSNVLTQNEMILLQILDFFMISYTTILIFVVIKEIHNYEIRETMKNLLLTIFTMLIICLIGFIVYVFGSQLVDFLFSWVKEVFFRVF